MLNDKDRQIVKDAVAKVLDDTALTEIFREARKNSKSDKFSEENRAGIAQYAKILEEIMTERNIMTEQNGAKRVPNGSKVQRARRKELSGVKQK